MSQGACKCARKGENTHVLEVGRLDLRVDVEPLKYLIARHSCHVVERLRNRLRPAPCTGRAEPADVPLNCISRPGLPPKMAIVVLWRSFMSVLNMAHVDAQFAFPTIAIFLHSHPRQRT